MIVTAEKVHAKIIHIGRGMANPEKYRARQVNGPVYMLTQKGHLRSLEHRSIPLSFLKTDHGPESLEISIVTR